MYIIISRSITDMYIVDITVINGNLFKILFHWILFLDIPKQTVAEINSLLSTVNDSVAL